MSNAAMELHCPVCVRTDTVEVKDYEVDNDHLTTYFKCNECGKSFGTVRGLVDWERTRPKQDVIHNASEYHQLLINSHKSDWASEPPTVFMGTGETDETK